MALCRDGDEAALKELFDRYKDHVQRAVRSRLSGPLRARFDTQDFTQDVWKSFFKVALDRVTVPDETALIAYLAQMAKYKVGEEFRHQNTQKVGIGRDMPLDDAGEQRGPSATPSAEAMANDQWVALTSGLSEREIRMLTMIRNGETHAVIAQEFGLSEKTVQRLVVRLQARPIG